MYLSWHVRGASADIFVLGRRPSESPRGARDRRPGARTELSRQPAPRRSLFLPNPQLAAQPAGGIGFAHRSLGKRHVNHMATDPEVAILVKQLSRYLHDHPHASDTPQGIARWWLEPDLVYEMTQLDEALRSLEGRGLIEPLRAADG